MKALKELILNKAVKKGNFTLASGKKSDLYIDCKQIFYIPQGLKLTKMVFSRIIGIDYNIPDCFGCVAIGGIPIAVLMSEQENIPYFFIRKTKKDHGIDQGSIEGYKPNTGDSVIMLEDVVTTGESIIYAANRAIQEHKVSILGIISLIDRQEGGRENIESHGFRFDSVFTREGLGL